MYDFLLFGVKALGASHSSGAEYSHYPSRLSPGSVSCLENTTLTQKSAQGFKESKRRMRRNYEKDGTEWVYLVGNQSYIGSWGCMIYSKLVQKKPPRDSVGRSILSFSHRLWLSFLNYILYIIKKASRTPSLTRIPSRLKSRNFIPFQSSHFPTPCSYVYISLIPSSQINYYPTSQPPLPIHPSPMPSDSAPSRSPFRASQTPIPPPSPPQPIHYPIAYLIPHTLCHTPPPYPQLHSLIPIPSINPPALSPTPHLPPTPMHTFSTHETSAKAYSTRFN